MARKQQKRGKAAGLARKATTAPPKRASKGAKSKSGRGGAAAGEEAEGHRVGLRGAAPWAARHAAKHAAEARARNSAPPKPGSARATLRTPEGAEQLKRRVARLHGALSQIRSLKKRLPTSFFQIGQILGQIRDEKLYEAKGYLSFETFVERELDVGKSVALGLSRVPSIFQERAALEHGMSAVLTALRALEEADASDEATRPALPLKPPSGRG